MTKMITGVPVYSAEWTVWEGRRAFEQSGGLFPLVILEPM